MFRPNQTCRIQLASGKTDLYGQPTPGRTITERCAVVKLLLTNEKSSVRADSSASRGNANEMQAVSVVLLAPTTRAAIDDILEIAGHKLRIMGYFPRFDVTGRLDHVQVEAHVWSNA